MKKDLIIIGAGLAGCFMAFCLAKRGYKVDVYEKYSLKEITKEASNRSFNLTLYTRGVVAFKKIGLWRAIRPVLRILKGSAAHSSHGIDYTQFETEEKPQYVIERPQLLRAILGEAMKRKEITFHFNKTLVALDKRKKTVTIQDTKTQKNHEIACEIVFGADGVNSLVRPFIQQGQNAMHKHEYHTWTYKQVHIPEKVAEKLNWVKESQNFVHADNVLVVGFPNVDKSHTAMVLLPEKALYTFSSLTSKEAIIDFLYERLPILAPAHKYFIKSILENPEGRLSTITTAPWYYDDFLVIIGDAAHALLPFYGQGISAAFEDCFMINRLIDRYKGNWKKIFPQYQEHRKRNTELLAYFSKESFERMHRYKQADITAVKNRLDLMLHTLMPNVWLPPIYQLIIGDPDDFDEILAKHNNREKVAKIWGITAAAWALYAALITKEKLITFITSDTFKNLHPSRGLKLLKLQNLVNINPSLEK